MKTCHSFCSVVAVGFGFLCLSFTGCQSVPKEVEGIPFKKGHSQTIVVAVMDMENQAGAFGQWNLGNGMAEMLVTRLMDTKKVTVLERQFLRDVLGELSLQQHEAFRSEGRVASGRLKNARYLIRGAVTEFSEAGGAKAYAERAPYGASAKANLAVVGLHLRIYDVETGEILSSIKAQGTAKSVSAGLGARYKGVTFGGEVFKQTPLGKATEQVIGKAVKGLIAALPIDYWHPLVAECDGSVVVVNGGDNVGLRIGDEFIVREKPRFVTDPATGNVIDTITGKQQGRIQIQKVSRLSSTAKLVEGTAGRGQVLEPVKK